MSSTRGSLTPSRSSAVPIILLDWRRDPCLFIFYRSDAQNYHENDGSERSHPLPPQITSSASCVWESQQDTGVTKSLKLYALRWKSTEDYTSYWRLQLRIEANKGSTCNRFLRKLARPLTSKLLLLLGLR